MDTNNQYEVWRNYPMQLRFSNTPTQAQASRERTCNLFWRSGKRVVGSRLVMTSVVRSLIYTN